MPKMSKTGKQFSDLIKQQEKNMTSFSTSVDGLNVAVSKLADTMIDNNVQKKLKGKTKKAPKKICKGKKGKAKDENRTTTLFRSDAAAESFKEGDVLAGLINSVVAIPEILNERNKLKKKLAQKKIDQKEAQKARELRTAAEAAAAPPAPPTPTPTPGATGMMPATAPKAPPTTSAPATPNRAQIPSRSPAVVTEGPAPGSGVVEAAETSTLPPFKKPSKKPTKVKKEKPSGGIGKLSATIEKLTKSIDDSKAAEVAKKHDRVDTLDKIEGVKKVVADVPQLIETNKKIDDIYKFLIDNPAASSSGPSTPDLTRPRGPRGPGGPRGLGALATPAVAATAAAAVVAGGSYLSTKQTNADIKEESDKKDIADRPILDSNKSDKDKLSELTKNAQALNLAQQKQAASSMLDMPTPFIYGRAAEIAKQTLQDENDEKAKKRYVDTLNVRTEQLDEWIKYDETRLKAEESYDGKRTIQKRIDFNRAVLSGRTNPPTATPAGVAVPPDSVIVPAPPIAVAPGTLINSRVASSPSRVGSADKGIAVPPDSVIVPPPPIAVAPGTLINSRVASSPSRVGSADKGIAVPPDSVIVPPPPIAVAPGTLINSRVASSPSRVGSADKGIAVRIASAETGGNPNLAYGDTFNKNKIVNKLRNKLQTAEEFSGGKKLTEMTIQEVQDFQKYREGSQKATGAVGKYQFIPSTLAGLVKDTKMDPKSTLFNEETQNKLNNSFQEQNLKVLRRKSEKLGLGSGISGGMQYMGHYIGAGGAGAVMEAAKNNPEQTVEQALMANKFKSPVIKDASGDLINAELRTIKVKDFEKILQARLDKTSPSQQSAPNPQNPGSKLYAGSLRVDDAKAAAAAVIINNSTQNTQNNVAPQNTNKPPIPSMMANSSATAANESSRL